MKGLDLWTGAASPRRWRRGAVTLGAVIALIALIKIVAIFRSTQDDAESTPIRPTVAIASATRQDVPTVLQALGTVTPFSAVTVRSMISGYLVSVTSREGEIIRRGDFLAQIDPRPYHASLAQAEGQLMRDAALLKNAQLDLARYQRLISQDSAAHQAFDTAQATVSQYAGAMQSDRAAIEMQRLNLEYCRIVSPTVGRVGLRQVDAGNFVQATDPAGLMVITQMQPISVIFVLPQAKLGTVLKHFRTNAKLVVEAFDAEGLEKLTTGTLVSIDNQIDSSTGTVKLRATFENTDNALFPNQFVNIRLVVDTIDNALTVPSTALRHGPSGDYLFVLGGNRVVHSRQVVTGAQYQGQTVITSGLTEAEKVVTDGISQLDNGVQVLTP